MKNAILIFLITAVTSYGQYWQQIDSIFAPFGVTVKAFTAPEFGDLDNDGDFDLILGNIDDRADYFKNIGTPQSPMFERDTSLLNPIYAGGLQGTNADYPKLVDLDADNDLDVIIGGYYGMLYYENIGTPEAPILQKVDTIFTFVNTEIGTDARPSFADLDDDGDLDLIVGAGETPFGPGPPSGVSLGYRNIGTPSSPNFVRDDLLVTGIIDVGLNCFPVLADMNSDGDFDLLIGRDLSSFVAYTNTGTAATHAWTRDFNTYASIENSSYWKIPTFFDLDGDSDYDLIYGTSTGRIYFYENTGSAQSPSFTYNANYFQVIKVGGSSAPSLADFDDDGDLDLLSGSTLDDFQYFENTGTSANPKFVKTTAPFSIIDAGFRCAPVFVDIDGDNDFDIVSGVSNGSVTAYINNGSSFSTNNTIFAGVSVNYQSVPTFADIDADGDLDLLVGSEDAGNTKFYENTGSNNFQLNTTVFSGVSFPSRCRPSLADTDNDGDIDLVIGRLFGNITFYENTGSPQTPIWTSNSEVFANIEVKQSAHPCFGDLNNDTKPDMILGEYDGNFTFFKNLFAPIIVDIEDEIQQPNDFALLQNYPNPFNPSTKIKFIIPFNVISNPAGGMRNLGDFSSSSTPRNDKWQVSLKVYDILGNEITTLLDENMPAGQYELEFNSENVAGGLSSGMYLFRLQISGQNGEPLFSKTVKGILLK